MPEGLIPILSAVEGSTLSSDDVVKIVLIGTGGLVATFFIVFSTVYYRGRERQRETTKREIAAYVAEGSISPEDAEKIIKARPEDE